ncbi:MAG TPA: ParB/Srx family N-terminal domain-containing protein [Tepidisphaeraceae bacterium]|jgi:ParB-like chromosome segregation protein Spo0J
MLLETVAIDSLRPDSANARKHGKRNLDAIMASLRRFGQQKPIVVDSCGVVRAGNGQFAAAKALGWSHVEIVRSDLQAAELTAYAIADNRTAELAEWDELVLSGQLSNDELGHVGFSEEEVRKFMEEPQVVFQAIADIRELFEVVVECPDERGQKQLYERLKGQGYSCRLFTL